MAIGWNGVLNGDFLTCQVIKFVITSCNSFPQVTNVVHLYYFIVSMFFLNLETIGIDHYSLELGSKNVYY